MGSGTTWLESEDLALAELVMAGHSPGDIARYHGDRIGGRSRNAIIGRCGRLDIRLNGNQPGGYPLIWTKTRLDELSRYYHGVIPHSQAEIADKMGLLPQQVAKGIMKLRKAQQQRGNLQRRKHRRAGTPNRSLQPRPLPPQQAAPNSAPVSFLELGRCHCRYVVAGEGFKAEFCGAQQWGNSSYCGFHHRLCHQAA
jgi:hypothetical protein